MPRKKRETKIEQSEVKNFQIKPKNRAARRWLWIGVGSVTAIIVLMWGWSFKELLANLNWRKSFESNLISGGQNDWNKLFGSEANNPKKDVKAELTEIIERIIKASSTSTSSTTFSTSTTTATSTTLNP